MLCHTPVGHHGSVIADDDAVLPNSMMTSRVGSQQQHAFLPYIDLASRQQSTALPVPAQLTTPRYRAKVCIQSDGLLSSAKCVIQFCCMSVSDAADALQRSISRANSSSSNMSSSSSVFSRPLTPQYQHQQQHQHQHHQQQQQQQRSMSCSSSSSSSAALVGGSSTARRLDSARRQAL
eukprot:18608-Heterococcus_DN1.PRE.1